MVCIYFVNYKYNVLLKRDDVCLIPLSTFVTLSRFDDGKEIRIARNKMASKSNAECCCDVVPTLWQLLTTSGSDVVTTSETDVGTTLIFDRATTL